MLDRLDQVCRESGIRLLPQESGLLYALIADRGGPAQVVARIRVPARVPRVDRDGRVARAKSPLWCYPSLIARAVTPR